MKELQKWAASLSIQFQKPIVATAFSFFLCQLVELIASGLVVVDHKSNCHWDCSWYESIVMSGYDDQPHSHYKGDAANWAFFPVFPMLARVLGYITGLPADDALVLTGKIAFLVSIYLFIRMARIYDVKAPTLLLALLPATSPYAIYGNTGYTEPVFLAFSCLFFIVLKAERMIAAGLVAGVLSATRFVGTTACLIYGVYAIRQWFLNKNKLVPPGLYLGFLLAPIGLAAFMFYLYRLTGDALAFSHIQIAWGRSLHNPLTVLSSGLTSGNLMMAYLAMSAVFGLACSIYLAIDKKWALALFSFFCTLIPLCTGLESMPRYVFWQAPVMMVLAMVFARTRLWPLIIGLSLPLLLQNYMLWFNFSTAVL